MSDQSNGAKSANAATVEPPLMTVRPAGMQEIVGPDGMRGVVYLFQVIDPEGKVFCHQTPQGLVPVSLMSAPIRIGRHLVAVPNGARILH